MQLGRISVWVSLDSSDTPAEELSTTYDVERLHHAATCYVQVRPGQSWSIHIEDSEPLEPPCVTSCLTYMDGHLVRGAKVHGGKPRQKVDAFWVSKDVEAPLAFGELQITDVEQEAVEMDEGEQEALGTIRVTCTEKYKTEQQRSRQRSNRSENQNRIPDVGGKIHETDKKAVTLGTRCVFGDTRPVQEAQLYRRPPQFGEWNVPPPPPPILRPIPDRPQLTFEFRYRTKLALDLLLGPDRADESGQEAEQRQIDADAAMKRSRSESAAPPESVRNVSNALKEEIKDESMGSIRLKTEEEPEVFDVDEYDYSDEEEGFQILPQPVIDLTGDSDDE